MEVFPILTLGERIRKLRKGRGLTLEALAGTKLTKGMLSLIENNKAVPSIESLNYIASQLGVDVSDLLQDENVQELRDILEQVEKLYFTDTKTLNNNKKYQQIKQMIEPFINHLTKGYESARLTELYGYSLYHVSEDKEDKNWKKYILSSAQMYEEMNLVDRRASVGTFQVKVQFRNHKYETALKMLLAERDYLEKNFPYMSPTTRLELDYLEAVLHFAVGNSLAAIRVIEDAIAFSKVHKVFYHIDDLYRITIGYGLVNHDEEKINNYLKKLLGYANFVEDPFYYAFNDYTEAEVRLFKHQDYEGVIRLVDKYVTGLDDTEVLKPYFSLTKGKALYGLGRYQEAVQWLERVEIPPFLPHPFDLTIFYVGDSYLALCYLELGQIETALKFATRAKEKTTPLPDTLFKSFIIDTYKKIVQHIV